jgi:hypothetical protein
VGGWCVGGVCVCVCLCVCITAGGGGSYSFGKNPGPLVWSHLQGLPLALPAAQDSRKWLRGLDMVIVFPAQFAQR